MNDLGLLRFGTTPEEAPVIHFNGPLTLNLYRGTGLTMVPGVGPLGAAALESPGPIVRSGGGPRIRQQAIVPDHRSGAIIRKVELE